MATVASTEEMLERYKKEYTSLLERCLNAESERDLNDRVYNYQKAEAEKAKARVKELEGLLKDAEDRNTELLAKIDVMSEMMEELGCVLETPEEEDNGI